jgi:hypothetical protein
MTTGCGRRCQFCVPDLNPQIDMPKANIMKAVQANVRDGNQQISLATEDMFIWGQVHTETPFYFPNREALLDLYASVVNTPGVEQHVLSHATMAPAVVHPILIRKLSDLLLDKSPIHLPVLSTHPKKKALVPLIGLETGSIRTAKQIMPSKGVPFPIDEWPSVVIRGLEVLNKNNWFPAITLIIGSPGETDDDTRATIDLIYEVERRGLFAFFIPSIFTPLHDTRMETQKGVAETRELTPLQWQLMMKCWKMNLRPGQMSSGADGVAPRRSVGRCCASSTARDSPAAVHVRKRLARVVDDQIGQDPRRTPVQRPHAERAAREGSPSAVEVPAPGHRRPAEPSNYRTIGSSNYRAVESSTIDPLSHRCIRCLGGSIGRWFDVSIVRYFDEERRHLGFHHLAHRIAGQRRHAAQRARHLVGCEPGPGPHLELGKIEPAIRSELNRDAHALAPVGIGRAHHGAIDDA